MKTKEVNEAIKNGTKFEALVLVTESKKTPGLHVNTILMPLNGVDAASFADKYGDPNAKRERVEREVQNKDTGIAEKVRSTNYEVWVGKDDPRYDKYMGMTHPIDSANFVVEDGGKPVTGRSTRAAIVDVKGIGQFSVNKGDKLVNIPYTTELTEVGDTRVPTPDEVVAAKEFTKEVGGVLFSRAMKNRAQQVVPTAPAPEAAPEVEVEADELPM